MPTLNHNAIDRASADELRPIAEAAIGRLLALGSRPTQPDDNREWWIIRRVVLAYDAAVKREASR